MNRDTMNWTQFFKEAGIPLSIAKSYSVIFEDNRISKDMLMDLSKEILADIGISAMGDVINILKHAKKIHSQPKRKETVSPASKTLVISNKRPPPPAAHSTTPGQASTVSTTSSSAKKKIVAKYSKGEIPDSRSPELPSQEEPEVTYVGYIIEPGKKEVVLEPQPQHNVRAQQLLASLDDQQETEYYLESTVPLVDHTEMAGGAELQESFETARYGASKVKRPMSSRMYSDEYVEHPQPKQPRVIILPGERQDIFTTSGLQKAAKVYETGDEQEGKLTTDRSRRLLESAGLIPAKDKMSEHSVFSRLDYKPSVTSTPTTNPHITVLTKTKTPPTTQKRIIKLTGATSDTLFSYTDSSSSTSDHPRTVTNISPASRRKIVSTEPARLPTARLLSASTGFRSPPSSRPMLVKKLVSQGGGARQVSERLGIRKTNPGSRTRVRDPVSIIASTIRRSPTRVRFSKGGGGGGGGGGDGGGTRAGRSGVFGYEAKEGREGGEGRSTALKLKEVRSSMVADEVEYQTRRQQDIRSRLEKREFEKRARRGGPLGHRLGSHQVFGRLE